MLQTNTFSKELQLLSKLIVKPKGAPTKGTIEIDW